MHRRLAAPLLLALACGPDNATDTTAATTGGETTESTPPTTGGPEPLPQTLMCVERGKLDVLLVIEDSPATSTSQDLAVTTAGLLATLAEVELDLDLHLAYVSASLGGKQCTNAAVHDGELLATSCRARLADFEDPVAAAACESACPFEQVEILPTTTAADPTPSPRPWLETITHTANVAVPLVQAAACLAPRGDAGCSFPAPLAAMARALDHALDPADPAFGFLRADAHLAVLFIGPTSDCSVRPAAQGIFTPESPFLSDPMLVTPGVCWNAGVACTGGPDDFTDCAPENFAADGTARVPDVDAVLEPVATYAARLQALVDDGLVASVGVGALTGVPTGFPQTEIPYSTATCTPADVARAGICPGCTADDRQASPPVRLRALAEAFPGDPDEPADLASLCSDDPSPLLVPFFGGLGVQLEPACVESCVVDSNPATPALDPDCTVTETRPDAAAVELPACDETPDGHVPPAGADACAAILTGDQRSLECRDQGRNAEVQIVRNSPAPDATCLSVTCIATTATPCAP